MANQNTHTSASKPSKSTKAQSKDTAKAQSKDTAKAQSKDTAEASAAKAETKIDDAADQTFPASDAPASWAGKDIAPQDREDAKKKQS
jgi:hypothetical protein